MKHLNIIIDPVKRWFHYEKPLSIEIPKNLKFYFLKDSNGNDVMCWLGWEAYSQENAF